MQAYLIPLLLVVSLVSSWAALRAGREVALPALLAVGWVAIALGLGGPLPMAAIGLASLIPLAGAGNERIAPMLRAASVAVAMLLLALAHPERLATAHEIGMFAAIALGVLLFVIRTPETNRVAGIEPAHLAMVAIGAGIVAIDQAHARAVQALPAWVAGAMIGALIAARPFGSATLQRVSADSASLLTAVLAADLALAGIWPPALILISIALLEIVVWLWTAARADRSNEKDQPRGAYVEGMAKGRTPRAAMWGTLVAGALIAVLALGASRGEWIAGLLGAAALMWLFQRFLWRQVPERRPH